MLIFLIKELYVLWIKINIYDFTINMDMLNILVTMHKFIKSNNLKNYICHIYIITEIDNVQD